MVLDYVRGTAPPRGHLRVAAYWNRVGFWAPPQSGTKTNPRPTRRVVELWTVPAEELLQTGDIGLVPWIPLTDFAGKHLRDGQQIGLLAGRASEEDRAKRKTESTLPAKTPGSDLDTVQSLFASMTRKRTKTTERQSGDAALLAKAMDALKAIRELKGLDPPKQTEVTGPQGRPIQVTVREMTAARFCNWLGNEECRRLALARRILTLDATRSRDLVSLMPPACLSAGDRYGRNSTMTSVPCAGCS